MNHLSTEQRAILSGKLLERQHSLESDLAEHPQNLVGLGQAPRERGQNSSEFPANTNDREVETALSDMDLQELAAVQLAQQRVQDDNFGNCVDCAQPIPFARLLIEPEALRCVACAAIFERKL
jgi:DnaK suppressor protein